MTELFARMKNGAVRTDPDFLTILNAIPTPLSWASLPGGEIHFVNQSFQDTFGYPAGHFANVEQWIREAYPRASHRQAATQYWEVLWKDGGQGIIQIPPLEFEIRRADGGLVTVQHRGIVLHNAGIGIATFEDISAHKLAKDALRRIALEDPLTGLANRRALQTRWSEAKSVPQAGEVAVLLLDLDDFKAVNDELGHEVGDEVLCLAAERLRNSVRRLDMVCRLGGDEFAVLLSHPVSQAVAERICGRILQAFQQPFPVAGQAVRLGASIGVSICPPRPAALKEMIRRADDALYDVKRAGKSGWRIVRPE